MWVVRRQLPHDLGIVTMDLATLRTISDLRSTDLRAGIICGSHSSSILRLKRQMILLRFESQIVRRLVLCTFGIHIGLEMIGG